MNSNTKRFLSLLLTVVMLFGMLPVAGVSATSASVSPGIERIYGDNRYETAFAVADVMKTCIGTDKFDSVVVAYGREFADALAGSYLAIAKKAPILLISQYNQDQVKDYIRGNVVEGGTVYLLGGTTVVPESMESGLEGFQVKRLWGQNRLGTNLAILKEVPVGNQDLLVCTGWDYADALSASATGLPILLLSPRGLTNEQKTFLEGVTGKIIICGGTNAVSAEMETALAQYGQVERLAGANRYQTSVMVAQRCIPNPSYAVLAYGRDFPDGLCGGVLANAINAPVILTQNTAIGEAKNYVQGKGLVEGVVLGGSGLVSDLAVNQIFGVVYTVTFDPCGGSEVPGQEVVAGDYAVEPESPVLDGSSFGGWYTDPYYTNPFDFSEPINADVVLYARWRAIDNLEDEEIDLGDIHYMASQGELEVLYGDKGEIRMIDGSFTNQTVNDEEDAAEVLNNAAPLFDEQEFHAEAEDITAITVEPGTDNEEKFFRYTPEYNGIPVIGSQIILTANKLGKVTGLFSSFVDKIYDVSTYTSIDEEYARTIALEELMDRDNIESFLENIPGYEDNEYTYEENFINSLNIDISQMIYAADRNRDPQLVYAVHVTNNDYAEEPGTDETPAPGAADGEGAPAIDQTIYVSANGSDYGEIYKVIDNTEGWQLVTLEATDALDTTRRFKGEEENGTFRLQDTSRNLITYQANGYSLPGTIAQSSVENGRTVIDKTAVSAHANMTATYDFYKNTLGRTSFDGRGATVRTSYDYGNNYNNAYWTSGGQQFVFGDGAPYAAALDIVGHEFTHAVIAYVVGDGRNTTLTYWGETGALNEAYADILGNFVEGKTGADFWNHGEDKGNVTRSMANPTAYDQPDHYDAFSDPAWDAQLDRYVGRDNEGVHIFGGIFCHAVYKMMTDSRTAGVSQETWAKIFYRSLFRLTTDATFLDARGAVICAAKSMGFDHNKQQAIKEAFDAVGIKEPDTVRFILTWGEVPRDLDSHLVGPGVDEGERFHVYYGDRTYYQDGSYWSDDSEYAVDLDYDDVTSFGPEVTTIHVLRPGEYYFYVHDYTNGYDADSTEMAHSGATINIYRGSASTPVATYNVDPSSSGTIWNVCKLTIGSNGTVFIEGINTYGSSRTYY